MRSNRGLFRILIVVLGIAVIAFGWYFLLWSPQQAKISSLNSAVSTIESQQSALNVQISQLEAAKRHLPELIAEARAVTGAIPSAPELSGFLSSLQTAAASSGVAELSVSPSAPSAATSTASTSGVTPLGVQISANGGYLEVLKFLSAIQSLQRLLIVNNVSIGKGGSGTTALSSSGPVLTLQLTGNIYELSQ